MRTSVLILTIVGTALAATCGQTPIAPNLVSSPENLIVGGTVATAYSWPWQVEWCAVGWFGGCSLECGGSVIDNNWVITAGHCVYDNMNADHYEVKAGVFDESSSTETGEQVVKVKAIHLHPDYNPRIPAHDIALIELATPITFGDHIQPVCLPTTDDSVIVPPNKAWVTGWGTTSEGGSISKQLRQVQVPFVDFATCEKEYRDIEEDVMICAGAEGIDSCQGDSGGPMVVQSSSGSWFQYGIVSFGKGCAEKGEAGVYSRMTAYCDFIATTTAGAVTCTAP